MTYTSSFDQYICLDVLAATDNPQGLVWQAMHQDYSDTYGAFEPVPTEEVAGERIVKHLLKGGRMHGGPFEHPQITFNLGYVPHSVMQQLRTHRVGISFDVQSFRYTGQQFVKWAEGYGDLEALIYFRPVGTYKDRQGKEYHYSSEDRERDMWFAQVMAHRYAKMVFQGRAEEHARGLLPFDYRQHMVVSVNARSLMHLLDVRYKSDAQIECKAVVDLMWQAFKRWMPAVAGWYSQNRLGKARLAP